jgi:hypothetical protein
MLEKFASFLQETQGLMESILQKTLKSTKTIK